MGLFVLKDQCILTSGSIQYKPALFLFATYLMKIKYWIVFVNLKLFEVLYVNLNINLHRVLILRVKLVPLENFFSLDFSVFILVLI